MNTKSFVLLFSLFTLIINNDHADAQDTTEHAYRFHISFGFGFAASRGTSNYKDFMRANGYFVNDNNASIVFYDHYYPPDVNYGSGSTIRGDYFIDNQFGFGAAISTLGKVIGSVPRVEATKSNYTYMPKVSTSSGIEETHTAMSYYLYGVVNPLNKNALAKNMFLKCGLGAGFARIDLTLRGGLPAYYYYASDSFQPQESISFIKNTFAAFGFISLERYIGNNFFIDISIEYNYFPKQTIDAVNIQAGTETIYSPDNSSSQTNIIRVSLPQHKINFSYFTYGISLGFGF